MADQASAGFDVIVIGSGASGGWAAKRLSEAGVKVGLLDAGRVLTPADYTEHKPPFATKYRDRAPEMIRRTRPKQKDCYACMEWNYDWFANDLEEPYQTPGDKPFSWQGRTRVVGGRTNVWGRQCYRLSPLDMKPASADGFGEDWPLSYEDLVPYYETVEDYVGITGMAEGVYELPDSKFHPPMGMHCAEWRFKNAVKAKFGRTATLGRSANLTKPINGRQACHYCGPCERGCVTKSYFNSSFTTVADALASGNCTLIPNAMAYKVLTDDANRARGVLYIDRVSREPKELSARAVVVCAQALESARLLLNSANERQPNGLGNSSGALGHYLMDHLWVAGGAEGDFPDLPGNPSLDGPRRPDGMYVIRFRNPHDGPKEPKFLRGYGFQGGASTGFNFGAPGFGLTFKQGLREPVTRLGLAGFGEVLPRYENFVEIDKDVVDVYGIPTLKIHMAWSDNERAMIPDMAASATEMLEAAGAKNIHPYQIPDRIPGYGIHEMGVARMGKDKKTSVLNQYQQAHDVDNLFVMDAAGFTSGGCQNPTLTIMALAVRSTDFLLGEMKNGHI
jgi:choline dehydrogenase-like flavoprotein